jgi:membrane-bound lytic murein transglycosylase D
VDARDKYDSLFQFYLANGPVPWKFGKAQGMAESLLMPRSTSSVGAMGLMQFMPATWREIMGDEQDPYDPELSIKAYSLYAPRIMEFLKTKDLEMMAAAYNWGMGNIRNRGEAWKYHLPHETEGYLRRIRGFYAEYVGED